MKLSELIAAIGDDNVGIQNLDVCADSLDWSTKRRVTKITFGTDQPLSLATDDAPNGLPRLGLVIWLPRVETKALLAKAKGDAK